MSTIAAAVAKSVDTNTNPSVDFERAGADHSDGNGNSAFGPSTVADRSVATSAPSRKNMTAFESMPGGSSPSGCDDTTPSNSSGDDRVPSATADTTTTTTTNNHGPSPGAVREAGPPEAGSNLHVSGLPSTVDDAALAAAFAPHGRVVSAKVMLHVETGVSRGFGFVLFQTAAEAEHARKTMHSMSIHGHGGRLQIALSMHRGENVTAESRVVYVRHVPKAVLGTPELTSFLASFGTVVKFGVHPDDSAKQPSSHHHRSRHTNYPTSDDLANIVVTFGSIDAARLCVAACHGKTPLPQCRVPLLSKMEEPQTLREQRLRDQRVVQQQKAAEVPVADASMIVASVKLPHVPVASERSGARTPASDKVAAHDERTSHSRHGAATSSTQQASRHARQRHPASTPNTQANPSAGQMTTPQPHQQASCYYGAPQGGSYPMMIPPSAAPPLPPPSLAPYGYQPPYFYAHPAYAHLGAAGGYGGAAPGMLPFPPMPGALNPAAQGAIPYPVPYPAAAAAASTQQAQPNPWNFYSASAGGPPFHPPPAS